MLVMELKVLKKFIKNDKEHLPPVSHFYKFILPAPAPNPTKRAQLPAPSGRLWEFLPALALVPSK